MIEKIRIVGGVAVVTATADFNPLRQLKALAKELESRSFHGQALFDLLALNGFADNRFVSIAFDGHKFDRASLAVESSVNSKLKSSQDSMAKSDLSFLGSTVLSSEELEHFLH
ncbi:MAG: type II toxin-antitoxin system RnlB family antitoxin [Pontibacterium sp.]